MSIKSFFAKRLPWMLVLFLFMACAYMFLLLRASMFSPPDYPVDQKPEYNEIWSYGDEDGDKKVVRIKLDGAIMRGSSMLLGSGVDMVASVKAQVRAATIDEDVDAILLEVNSPGGGVTPSDEIYHALLKFKEEKDGRKVVVLSRDLMASGGYYVAMAADHIVAEPTSLIGSIGVLIQSMNVAEMMEKVGVKDVTVVSEKSDNKTLLSPFKEMEEEEQEILQTLVDEMYDRFASIVKTGRGLDAAVMDEFADGRIFGPQFALENDFIDEIGYFEDALASLGKQLDETDPDELHVVRYAMPRSVVESLLGVEAGGAGVAMPDLPGGLRSGTRVMYLWR